MNKVIRRIVSFLLVIALLAGTCPCAWHDINAEAATSGASLSCLGRVGTLKVGSKTKKGSWWKMRVGGSEVFCLNLGATCHTGDVYQSEATTYSSSDSGKKGLEAYIGYWFDQTKKRSNRAYIIAQALFWAVEEGDTSESELKAVIKTMQGNTGYFTDKSVGELYEEIFEKTGILTVNIALWKYAGSGSKRQVLLDVVGTSTVNPKLKHVNRRTVYRQRITLHKTDEFDTPVPKVTFLLEADNVDELYYFKAIGWGATETGEVDDDADNFELVMMTDSKGQIAYRFNYELQSEDYYYYEADDLDLMDSNARKKAFDELKEDGYRCGKSLTKAEAEEMVDLDLKNQMKLIENDYRIQEIDSGNPHLLVNPDYANVETVTLKEERSWEMESGEWPETTEGSFENYFKAYQLNVQDQYKKVSVEVNKKDGESSDGKAHGDASLDGAMFQLYEDAACTKKARVYGLGERKVFTAEPYVVAGGKFVTDYMMSGKTYYLKEIQSPRGYHASTQVLEIKADGSRYDVEYTPETAKYEVRNKPILGRIAIQKYTTDGKTGPIQSEKGAVFQIYLKSAGSYEASDAYERATITTDDTGYACTGDLYFGTYKIHQVGIGEQDAEKINDFEVVISEEKRQEPYYYFTLNNHPFNAYLRVVKKDGNTEKTVLKEGTTYQIYRVDKVTGQQFLVTQSYVDGNVAKTVDQFQSDETGTIMTVNPLSSGTYRIYETEAASGFHISKPFIEVEINSQKDNYVTETDSEGNVYTTITLDYENDETYGKLSLLKTGEELMDFQDGRFVYDTGYLKGTVFEIYARDEITTQDNQGAAWFAKDELACTITTGVGAEFTSECGGICDFAMDGHGIITVQLPLGKYRVVEKQTVYGYILPEKNAWDVEFTWDNKDEVYVLDSSDTTDEYGTMHIRNDRARAAVSVEKSDCEDAAPIRGAIFGLYSKNNIYNAAGTKIVDADTLLGTVETDGDGKADFDLDLPLMSEGYVEEVGDAASGGAIREDGAPTGEIQEGDSETTGLRLNSGDYYLKEQSVSDSYYINTETYPIHLEYQDAETAVVGSRTAVKEVQTSVEIDKVSVTGSGEVSGCALQLADEEGNVIVSWVSGRADSVKFLARQRELGYENLKAEMDGKGNLVIGGLLHDQGYTLTETRPANGYVTADSITFRLTANQTDPNQIGSKTATRVDVRDASGEYAIGNGNVVKMVDEQTNVQFVKIAGDSGKFLAGAKIAVYDQGGKLVASFTTKGDAAAELRGVLTVGQTYTFRETKAPKYYMKAGDVHLTVRDTSAVQLVNMKDKLAKLTETKKVPRSSVVQPSTKIPKVKADGDRQPKTGSTENIIVFVLLLVVSGAFIGGTCWNRRTRRGAGRDRNRR